MLAKVMVGALLLALGSANIKMDDEDTQMLTREGVQTYIERCLSPDDNSRPGDVDPRTLDLNKCLPPDNDLECEQPVMAYYVDGDSGECVKGKTCDDEHAFESLQQCHYACENPCEEKFDSGESCDDSPPHDAYYFDQQSLLCKKYTHKGCDGGKNSFDELEDCQKLCEDKKDRKARSLSQPGDIDVDDTDSFCEDFEEKFPGVVSKIMNSDDESDSEVNPNAISDDVDELDDDSSSVDDSNPDVSEEYVEGESESNSTAVGHRSKRAILAALGIFARRLNWIEVVQRDSSRRFDVTVRIKCWRALIKRPSSSEFRRLCGLIKSGIRKYWSRQITWSGRSWSVNVNVVEKLLFSKKIIIKYYNSNAGNTRSHNSDIYPMTMKYRAYWGRAAADRDFEETAAHEAGHSILWAARGLTYSWGHKGTSTIFGKTKSPPATGYGSSGEIDLMKYYTGGKPSNFYSRVKLVSGDAIDMIRHASRPRGALCLRDSQCLSGRCSLGRCVDCESDSHCPLTQYCWGRLIPLTVNECRTRRGVGAVCSRDRQCANGFCDGFRCGECEGDSHCASDEYCKNKNLPFVKNVCAKRKCKGWCSRGRMCRSGKCRFFRCKRC